MQQSRPTSLSLHTVKGEWGAPGGGTEPAGGEAPLEAAASTPTGL
jgi:hypothetical protein